MDGSTTTLAQRAEAYVPCVQEFERISTKRRRPDWRKRDAHAMPTKRGGRGACCERSPGSTARA